MRSPSLHAVLPVRAVSVFAISWHSFGTQMSACSDAMLGPLSDKAHTSPCSLHPAVMSSSNVPSDFVDILHSLPSVSMLQSTATCMTTLINLVKVSSICSLHP